MKYPLYRFMRVIITFYIKVFYRVEYVGKENIPLDGSFILAGNHKNSLDCLVLISSTRRTIRFLAKDELMSKVGWLFKRMAIIPVNRKKKNKEALNEACKELRNGNVIGVFPEGTFNRTEYVIMPFKYGAVKMSLEAKAPIVPFAIINDYKLFQRSVKIVFDQPYIVQNKDDLKQENIILMNKVINLLRSDDCVKK